MFFTSKSMNKNISLLTTLFATLLLTCSCSEDFWDLRPSEIPTDCGMLYSGTHLDRNLPDGYRIGSVGGMVFYYDPYGRLESIYNGNESIRFVDGVLAYADSRVSYKAALNSHGLVQKVEFSYRDGGYSDSKESGTARMYYNSYDQLQSITIRANWTEYQGGYRSSGSYEDNYSLRYIDNGRLNWIEHNWKENGEHRESGRRTYQFRYTYGAYESMNNFWQYTPKMVECVLNDVEALGAFAYLGLMGRASSKLPSRIEYEAVSYFEGEPEGNLDQGYILCGPYSTNFYSALRTADNVPYEYKSFVPGRMSVRAAAPENSVVQPRRWFERPSRRH